MRVEQLTAKQQLYLKNHHLTKKYLKQITLLVQNPKHPSLNVEKLIPVSLNLYSFRLDIHYRAIFRYSLDIIKIIVITNHYK